MSTDWIPSLAGGGGPIYLAIVEALADDVAQGRLKPGARLLTQRDMAERLGISVGTISKAYAEAERRGVIESAVGRGTFVRSAALAPRTAKRAATSGAPIDLGLNAPPPTGEGALIAAAMAQIAQSPEEMDHLLTYPPHAGLPGHRDIVAAWLARQRRGVDADQIVLCNGAQHAISVALAVVARPGDTVLTEAATYTGIVAAAEVAGHALYGVGMDEEGLRPDRLEAAFRDTGARVLYCTPTLQTPTATTMSEQRRKDIAAIVKRHDAMVIEDDVYSFLAPEATPLTVFTPKRGFHISSFAKCAAPGLRFGALELPDWAFAHALNAVRASGWAATPLISALVTHMIEDGSMDELIARKRAAARERAALAQEYFPSQMAPRSSAAFHLWAPLTRPVAEAIAAAAMRGVLLSPPTIVPGDAPPSGVRLCIGAPHNIETLTAALTSVASVLESDGRHLLV